MNELSNAPVLRTRLTAYRIDTSTAEGQDEYDRLKAKMSEDGIKRFRVYSLNRREWDVISGDVDLECRHVFDNQWNTTDTSPSNPGFRVFDWYEGIVPNRKLRIGHYLEMTDEMRAIRSDVLRCGFCGNHEWASEADNFCDKCLGSEYLEKAQLHLLRLMPCTGMNERAPLTEEELEQLLPKYEAEQEKTNAVLREKERQRVIEACDLAIMERDGKLWLLDHKLMLDNCIFYGHKKQFCFGWNKPLSEDQKEFLTEKLKDFPFDYELK